MAVTTRGAAALGALTASALLLLTSASPSAQGGKYSVKAVKAEPPKELKGDIAKLLSPEAIQLEGGSGGAVCTVWLRKEVPAEATAEQVQNGLTYRELAQTMLLGAIRFDRDWTDIRKQKVKAGVYTMRLGFQPEDGDHAGASPTKDFVVLVAAAKEKGPGTMEPKELQELSQKSIDTGHPAVFMLYPNPKPGAAPQLEMKDGKYWVVNTKENVLAAGKKTTIGIGLTLVGHAD
jgi:hypothetical protein